MSYAIVGLGYMGQALARAFACEGNEVSVATTATLRALHLQHSR